MRPPDKYAATYEVLVDGQAVDKKVADHVFSITLEDSLGLPDVCRLRVGFETEPGREPHIDDSPFKIGSALEVKLGERDGPAAPETVFKGETVTIEPSFTGGLANVEIRAYDRSHRLHSKQMTRTWAEQSFSDVIASICSEAGLSPEVDAMPQFKHLQQTNESDWRFIWRIADRFGYELAVDDTKVICRRPGTGPTVELQYPRDLVSFAPRMTGVQQVKKVTVTGWDELSGEVLSGEASSPDMHTVAGISREAVVAAMPAAGELKVVLPVHDAQDAREVAQGLLNRIGNSYVEGEGTTFGNPSVRAGTMISLTGLGRDFDGRYRVYSTRHTVSGGGTYQTSFTTYQSNTVTDLLGGGGTSPAGPAGIAGFHGTVVVGRVTDNVDPEELGRVSVWFPTLGGNQSSAWARVAIPGAGPARGVWMLPLVGDEVLVAFEHGDPLKPYVIGALHSGADKPHSEQVADDSPFVVRSETRITMRAKKEIEVEAGETYTLLVHKDAKQTFEAKLDVGVTGDVTLKVSQGGITVESNRDISIKASGPGANINIEASGQMNLKAPMGLTVDGGMNTTVKGQMVNVSGQMINLG